MTAPSPMARADPSTQGIKLKDGYSTKITLALDPDIEFWEKTVTPPGVDGGDAIENTTMHNTAWRTFAPRSLKTLTEVSLTAAYDPDLYDQIVEACNLETTITVTFPDGSTLAFYGYLRTFNPGEHVEGDPPECTIVIQPTNFDPGAKVEAGPALAEVEGT